MQTSLLDLNQDEHAVIVDVSSSHIPFKLIEMGCLPGNAIKILRTAPLNDPILIDVNGTQLAIRKATAKHIIIKKETHA